jgi:hypothetical protein
MKLKHTDETILVFAFRYALGRKSAAPGIVADHLIKRWADLAPHSQAQVKEEIATAISRGDAGDPCDVETWQGVLKL